MKKAAEALLALSLFSLSIAAAACSGGGGGDDDDDDGTLPTPERPGFVVMRLDTMLSIARADGATLVDVDDGPGGEKSLVGFTEDDRVIYMDKAAVSSTAGDLWITAVDGSGNALLSPGIYGVYGWADGSHLLVQRGPAPELAFPPRRDLLVVGAEGNTTPLADSVEDESFAGQVGTTVVFYRGVPTQDCDLFAIPALGGTEVQLTDDGGPKRFAGFAGTRAVYEAGATADVYSVDVSGAGDPVVLGDRANAEAVVGIRGNRVVIKEIIPLKDAVEGDLYAVDADGANEADLAATADFPEDLAGITGDANAVVLRQTSFDPILYELFTIPLAGGTETILGDVTGGAVLLVNAETIVYSSGEPGEADIFAIESDGSDLRTLAENPGDDTYLAFANGHVLFKNGTPEKVWTVDLDGGDAERLRETPDGEQLATVLGPMVVLAAGGDLFAANTSGGGLRTLSADPETDAFRAITPDGRVIFTRNSAFLDDVWIVNGDGTGEVNLSDRIDEDEYLGFLP